MGLSKQRRTKIYAWLDRELDELGVIPTWLPQQRSLKNRCLAAPSCVQKELSTQGAIGGLTLSIIRAGPTLDIEIRALSVDTGRETTRVASTAPVKDFPRPADLRPGLQSTLNTLKDAAGIPLTTSVEPAKPEPADPAEPADPVSPRETDSLSSEPLTVEPLGPLSQPVSQPLEPTSGPSVTSIVTLGLGIVAATAGGITAYSQSQRIDAESNTGDKEQARLLTQVGVGGIVVGAVLFIAGTVLTGLELWDD
ncbi:hypothetical protein ACFL6C_06210 [Myxococcota bacterium]